MIVVAKQQMKYARLSADLHDGYGKCFLQYEEVRDQLKDILL